MGKEVSDILDIGYSSLLRNDRIFLRAMPRDFKFYITSLALSEILLDFNAQWYTEDNDHIMIPPLVILDPKNIEIREQIKEFSRKNKVYFKPVLYNKGEERKNLGYEFLNPDHLFDGHFLKGSKFSNPEEWFLSKSLHLYLHHQDRIFDWTIDVSYLYHIGAFDSYGKDIQEIIWNRLVSASVDNAVRGKYFKFLY